MSDGLKSGWLIKEPENKHITYIDDRNTHLLNSILDEDNIYFINLTDCHKSNSLRSFTVKFNIGNNIIYPDSFKEMSIIPDQIFLSTRQTGGKNYSDRNNTQSICIDISTSVIEKAFYEVKKSHRFTDEYSKEYFMYPNFFEHVYGLEDFPAASKLKMLKDALSDANPDLSFIDHNWFAAFAQDIVLGEYDFFLKLKNLKSIKKITTRKEILSRLLIGKKYIDENYLQNPSIAAVASHSYMSIFYFFRTFREVFGITPYHYSMHKRLNHALSLLIHDKLSVAQIALRCGFPDTFTFSKAFKREFGYSPSKYPSMIAA